MSFNDEVKKDSLVCDSCKKLKVDVNEYFDIDVGEVNSDLMLCDDCFKKMRLI